MQKQGEAARLALAATRSDRLKPLRRIMERRVRIMVEESMHGIILPGIPRDARKFLDGVDGISQKVIGEQGGMLIDMRRRRIRGLVLNKQLEALKGELLHLRRVIKVPLLSRTPAHYAKYLGRPDFDIDVFLHSIGLFGKGRKVEFSPVSQRIKDIRKDFLKKLEKKDSEALISLMKRNLSEAKDDPAVAYEVLGLLTDDIELASSLLARAHPKRYYQMKECLDNEDFEGAGVLFLDEVDVDARWDVLRSLTDMGIYVDPYEGQLLPFDESFSLDGISGFIASDGKALHRNGLEGLSIENEMIVVTRSTAQHELQHIFDNISLTEGELGPEEEREYRAYLGELSFSEDRVSIAAHLLNGENEEPEDNGHYPARRRVGRLMREAKVNSAEAIIPFAMDLLNEAYKQACGLTYSQIIEPFRKK
jgi:hypothetical protein